MSWKNNKNLSELLRKVFTNQRVGWIYGSNSGLCAIYGTVLRDDLDKASLNWAMAVLLFVVAVFFWSLPKDE